MSAMRRVSWAVLGVAFVLAGCGGKRVEWNAPENFLYGEKSKKTEGGIQLEYWSLVDHTCQAGYDALADVEHYTEFIPGVDRTQVLNVTPNSKTIQIAQRVIGRMSNAKTEWTFDRVKRRIDFKTLSSDLTYTDGHYDYQESPDGKRCVVHSTFLVREGQGRAQSVPIGVLAQGTRDTFLAAAKGVKARAVGVNS